MPYLYRNISTTRPDQFPLYFLDANVWIYRLNPPQSLRPREKEYVQFFDHVVKMHLTQQAIQPKFVLTTLLVSEVVNRFVRTDWQSRQQQFPNFKQDYRQSRYYTQALKYIHSEFQTYSDYCMYLDDHCTQIDIPNTILPQMVTSGIDFNDLYFANLMKQQNIAIVTNDGDFVFEDIPIVSANTNLLKLK